MSSTYGEHLKLSLFGQSHGPAIGMVLDGIPAGLPVDTDALQTFLNRRAPGQNDWSTPRKEEDAPQFLGGLLDGYTCGAPIAAVIPNRNTRSGDYSELLTCPRPGHADFTADVKYGGYQDAAGGGHFSGRLTATLCIAGGLCLQWLEQQGIRIGAHILNIGGVADEPVALDWLDPDFASIGKGFPVVNSRAGEQMKAVIAQAKAQGDSVGGIIECIVTGLPAGLGEPMFGGLESKVAQIVLGIPAVKGIDFGIGFTGSYLRGREHNDCFCLKNGAVLTSTNHAGGVLGGIATGMPFVFSAAFKPTPSIALPQETLDLATGQQLPLVVKGRHDPCIVPRAVPVMEAAAAIAIYDLILGNTQCKRRKDHGINRASRPD